MRGHHSGWLEALTGCELLVVNVVAFLDVLCECKEAKMIMQHYGKALYEAMGQQSDALDDLSLAVQHSSIVMRMPAEVRSLMSMPALRARMQQQSIWENWTHKGIQELKKEVKAGRCDLIQD